MAIFNSLTCVHQNPPPNRCGRLIVIRQLRSRRGPLLIENGQRRAEIVISEKPQRSTRLAAQELQDGIQKISSARLPSVTQPNSGAVHVFVGQSERTERLKVTAEGLRDGAFRMISVADLLTLIGDDSEFTPIEQWKKNNAEIVNGKTQAEWEKITGATCGLPNILMYKSRFSLTAENGRPLKNFDAIGKWRTEDGYEKKGVGNQKWPIEPARRIVAGRAKMLIPQRVHSDGATARGR